MITQRDIELFKFINVFGKTYYKVLAKTFWESEKVASLRITKLKNMGLVTLRKTNLENPRLAIVLTKETQEFLQETFNIKPKKYKFAMGTLEHNIIEQISFFWLKKIGDVERTTVSNHHGKMRHVPDFILRKNGRAINIEIELTKKSKNRYAEIFFKCNEDGVNFLLYVFKNKQSIKSFAVHMPKNSKLHLIDIDTLVENIKSKNEIDPFSQIEILQNK